jgi:uncharacterized repeat protein (TIGR02543 family)
LAGGAVATPNAEEYTIESDAITLTNPTREGYTFAGWTGTELTAATAAVTIAKGSIGNRSYTATWTPITYTISYELAGGAVATENPTSYTIESEAITLTNPTRTGYEFAGWTGTDLTAATTTLTIAKGSIGNRSYTATWTPITYTISYDLAGGAVATENPTSYTIESEAITLTNPTRTGYTFAGWTGTDLTAATAAVTIAKGSIGTRTYTATWTINQYTITFNTDGGSAVDAITQDYNTAVTAPAAPTKTGYTFAGWSPAVPQTMPAENITVTAQWTINQYTITFNTDGGSAIAAITQDYNTAVTAPAAPTKTGYTFAGWDKEIPATMPAENITVTAQWTINQYTITFNTDGGSAIAAITQDYNTAVTAPAAPTKTGYTFAGWSPAVPQTMPAENITVTAQWTINQYTITFNTDGGSAIDAITQDYNTSVTAPAAPTKTGYTFAGWDKEIPATMPAENITVTAQWTINQYTITFNTDGGSAIDAITQDYNTAVTAPAAPTKTGYTFAGWDKEIPATMPAENITIKALWTINQYTITFNTDGGSAIDAITQDYNTTVTAPAAPTKTGYTFAGWDKEIPVTMPAENITVTAQWTINQYTITFNTDGGSAIAAITQDYNTAVTAPAAPTKEQSQPCCSPER